MTEEEKREAIRNYFGRGSDPRKYPKGNHCSCARCGKKLYMPMPPRELYEKRGCMSWIILTISYVFSRGWTVVKKGDFNGEYVCPDCQKPNEDLKRPIDSPYVNDALEAYKEYVEEQRKKFDYYQY